MKTKLTNLFYFYDEEKGYFSQVAGSRENVVNSWVGGAPAGFGFLKLAEVFQDKDLQEKAEKFLDFLATDSLSASGFSYPFYDRKENRWSTNGWWKGPYLTGIPSRMASENSFYLLKAYLAEKIHGREHLLWLKTAQSNLEAGVKIWQDNHDLGYAYKESKTEIERAGTAAGILWIGALSLGYQITGEEKYLAAAKEAGDYYDQNFLQKGLLYGCELDQGFAPDASCAAHGLAAYVELYQTTKENKYLLMAQKAADLYATFVFSYDLPFAKSSEAGKRDWTSLGLSTSGARNNHLTSGCWPGFIEYLVKLAFLSEDNDYLKLAVDQYRAGLEGYALNDWEFYDVPGLGSPKKGFGFDWILHSDWGGERVWFGGVMHAGMLHQIYLPAANWLATRSEFGEIIVDGRKQEAVSFNSWEVKTSFLSKPFLMTILKINNPLHDKLKREVKIYFRNFPKGEYRVFGDQWGRKIKMSPEGTALTFILAKNKNLILVKL